MSEKLAEIVRPLVEKGQFENSESAVRNLMVDYVLGQVERYQKLIQKYEKKYGMRYDHFSQYLKERAKRLKTDPSLHNTFMVEEEDALEWKMATEMLQSWLGMRDMIHHEPIE